MTDVKLCRLQRRQENQRYAYVVKRKEDDWYFLGCGYAGPGKPVPYFRNEIDTAKIYFTAHGARQAAEKYGGAVGFVEVDSVTALLIRNYLETRKDRSEALFVTRMGVRFKEGGIRDMLKRLEERSGVSHVHPHKFRRTYATNMARRGMKIQVIAKLMGHDKIETTMTYVMLYKEDIKHDYQHYYAS